jgi:trehalose 6-phosphate phosphatase
MKAARDILRPANLGVLEDFARSSVLVALDYDGTLAPIVDDPDRAEMRPRTRRLLQSLARVYPVAVISGRARTDVARRLRDVAVASIIGNHGVESWHIAGGRLAEVRRWLPVLADALAPYKGVAIEDKSYSLAIHYRQSREKKRARAAILTAAAALPGVRIIAGKQVVNVLPRDAPHKGIALERERDRLGCDTAIYVGDDQTDEDVFTLDQPGRLLAVRVGLGGRSAATYGIANQRAIDRLLGCLEQYRRHAGARQEAST